MSKQQESQYFSSIKKLLLKPCKHIKTTKLSVNSYKQVIDLWLQYKEKEINIKDYFIRSAFEFHLNTFDHVILYHSYNLDTSLLMCKIGEKYKNITIKNDELNKIHYFYKYTPNFIATYC